MSRRRAVRWIVRAMAAYMAVGFIVWIVAIVRHPGAFGPIEWIWASVGYILAWPVYLPLLFRE